jgi:hypothetical protein
VDFPAPLAPPDGPRLRRAVVAVSGEGVVAKETGLAASAATPEVLVTSVDSTNAGRTPTDHAATGGDGAGRGAQPGNAGAVR